MDLEFSTHESQILVISGASGSGKTTTCYLLEKLFPAKYSHILFDRSRLSRPGEFGSRHVDAEKMYENYQKGLYTNLAMVTHGGLAAVRREDVLNAFRNGKTAVMEFPVEKVSELRKWFPGSLITTIELVAPSEKERLRRLMKDHKYTDERIEGAIYGAGRISSYKSGRDLVLSDVDLVLITECGNFVKVVLKIESYMQIKNTTVMQLKSIESKGIDYVRAFLRFLNNHNQWNRYPSVEGIDKDFIDLFGLEVK